MTALAVRRKRRPVGGAHRFSGGIARETDKGIKMSRPLPKVMTVTAAAAARVQDIIANSDKPIAGLKIGVKNGGCAGMEYTLDYAETIDDGVDVVEDRGVKIVIDPKAILFLLGTEMDYEVSKLSSGFVFHNPNQTSACGCGESVAITPVSEEMAEKYAASQRGGN